MATGLLIVLIVITVLFWLLVIAAAGWKPAAAAPAAAKPAAKAAAKSGDDDLTRISGVGPTIVKKLNKMGVTTFAEIAGWSAADVERVDEELNFKGRIEREDWIAQARKLAGG